MASSSPASGTALDIVLHLSCQHSLRACVTASQDLDALCAGVGSDCLHLSLRTTFRRFSHGPSWSCWSGGGNWPASWKNLWHRGNMGALARMTFPLLAGMVIARKGWKIRTGNASLWICIAILSFIFFAPEMRPIKPNNGPLYSKAILSFLGLTASYPLNGRFEALAVIIGMPLVLLLGVGGEIRNVKLAAICRFLGRYSFPLYCTHYPMTILQRVWRDAHPDAPWQMHLATACACAFSRSLTPTSP